MHSVSEGCVHGNRVGIRKLDTNTRGPYGGATTYLLHIILLFNFVTFIFLFCVNVCVCMYHDTCVEVREQCLGSGLSSTICFLGSISGCQAWQVPLPAEPSSIPICNSAFSKLVFTMCMGVVSVYVCLCTMCVPGAQRSE